MNILGGLQTFLLRLWVGDCLKEEDVDLSDSPSHLHCLSISSAECSYSVDLDHSTEHSVRTKTHQSCTCRHTSHDRLSHS